MGCEVEGEEFGEGGAPGFWRWGEGVSNMEKGGNGREVTVCGIPGENVNWDERDVVLVASFDEECGVVVGD